jgi:hypothetical protein
MVKLEKNTEDPFKLPEASEQVCCTILDSLLRQSVWGTFSQESIFIILQYTPVTVLLLFDTVV